MALTTDVPQSLTAPLDRATVQLESLAGLFDADSWARLLVENQLPAVFACSPFVLDLCLRHPEFLRDALAVPLDQRRPDSAAPAAVVSALVSEHLEGGLSEEALMVGLRRYRNTEMLRIAIADLLGFVDVLDTLEALTALADACIQGAEYFVHHTLMKRHGEPRDQEGRAQRLIVLAMGKLGGHELNFSSDIDLICAYRSSGSTSGSSDNSSVRDRAIDNEVFFRRVTQGIARVLGKRTEDGFVFRVDLRLRPFGDSGPLVMNFDGLENYYLTQGREWERYAMIKARAVCGLADDRAEIAALLEPFIYRRYLDYSAFESLRDLKQRIAAQVQQKGMQDNIKLGPGGIREIEFTGQAFQLVRGGREPSLKERPILTVLNAVKQLELLPAADVDALHAAYLFLRRTENYLQMMRDEQVHALPQHEEDKTRLRYAMGYDSWASFHSDLSTHRALVQQLFQSLFHTETDDELDERAADPLALLWLSGATDEAHASELAKQGFEHPEQVRSALAELADSVFYRNLTQQAQQRLDRLVPMILHAVARQSGSWRALQGLLRLVRGIAGRSVYLQVLVETPAALELLTRLFSKSSFIAEFVCQHPIVIDELLDYRHIENPPDRESMERDVAFILERVSKEELDVQMDALRQFQQANMMRVAAAELEGQLDLMRVSDRLTWLAELTLQAVSDLVWDQMIERFGRPQCVVGEGLSEARRPEGRTPVGRTPEARTPVGRTPGFSIVGYGKLGGYELGYASDLDIVFLHESEGTEQWTMGPKVIENQVFFARLAQKVVHFISTFTPAGVLYEIDTRLRPNGQSGMLVSSLAAFELYHQREAWTWEHQALVRARVVVGNQRIRQRFAGIRQEVLCRQRPVQELRQDVADMRRRMRVELGAGGDTFDLKQDLGGIADIEFMVQYMVLWKASVDSSLATDTDNVRLLKRIGELGFITPQMADELRNAYLEFRRFTHRLALLDQKAVIASDMPENEWSPEELAALSQHRDRVRSHWQQLMELALSE